MVAEKKVPKSHLQWFSGIFEPTVDFFELLNVQADKTLEGVQALAKWLKEDGTDRCQIVRDLEKEADEMKLDLEKKLVRSFVTPFDREDIYELSTTMDEVINAAKNVCREMEAFQVAPQGTRLQEMAEMLVEGTTCLNTSIHALRTDLRLAADQALQTRKTDTRTAKVYRAAIQELLETDDFKRIFKVKEVYKVLMEGAERIDRVGETLLHAIVKMS
jgi:predicted phosphate transport protein (TIGR00153 family)